MREVAAERERPALLFSGGKDSIVLLRLAEKAFRPGALPFPVMHVDTVHNFPEVIEFRDRRVKDLGERLIVASVQESIDTAVRWRSGCWRPVSMSLTSRPSWPPGSGCSTPVTTARPTPTTRTRSQWSRSAPWAFGCCRSTAACRPFGCWSTTARR